MRSNLHRHLDKRKWISTERGGFTIAPKLKIPETTRLSNLTMIEPYEDPELEPGFVRTERAFLKDQGIRTAKRDLELKEKAAMSMADTSITKSIDHTFLKEVDRGSTMHSSGMSMINEKVSKDNAFFNKS